MLLKSLVFLFIAGSGFTCAAHKPRKMSLSKNVAIAKQWNCSLPQPRLIHIDSIGEYANKPNVFYHPRAILIHRCDQSTGCCMKLGDICTSIEQEEEDVTFVVQQVEHSSAPGSGKHKRHYNHAGPTALKEKIQIHMKNHTACECASRVNSRS